jgi:hypothetical protein
MFPSQNAVEKVLRPLIGAPLWAAHRAADMATFQFGERHPATNLLGRACEVGDFALHVQCAWRIVRQNRILVASDDLYFPSNYDRDPGVPEDFDWDRDPNLRDALLADLFHDGHAALHTSEVEAGPAGRVTLHFTGDAQLDVLPNMSLRREHWRLLRPKSDSEHFVVSAETPS